jgi:hypothetical protein
MRQGKWFAGPSDFDLNKFRSRIRFTTQLENEPVPSLKVFAGLTQK